MTQMQVIGKEGSNLKPNIRTAIQEGKIKTFQVVQVKGGLKIKHTKFPGSIKLTQEKNILSAKVACRNKSMEWKIFESFIGRLAYHFKDDILAINIQF